MKKVMIALASAMIMSATVMAQDNNTADKQDRQGRRLDKTEMVKHRTDMTVKQLGLNDDQAKKLLDLNTKYADKMGGPMGGPGRGFGPRGQRGGNNDGKRPELTEEQKQKMQAMRQEREEAIKAYETELEQILTPEQFKNYKAEMQKRQHGGPRGGHRHGGPRPQM